jgi:RNA polymerase sigma-70 factor (ECF subfamily)
MRFMKGTELMGDDDAAPFEAWQRGEEAAVRAVFGVYFPRAVRLAALSGLTPEAAQDCAQEAFVQAFERRNQLRDPRAFPLWFHRIVTRHMLDMLATQGHERALPLESAASRAEDWQRRQLPQPEDEAIAAEARSQLWQRVQALPPHHRVPLVLRYYGSFSLREVAALMGSREGTVRVTIHRALRQLRDQTAAQSQEPIAESARE